MFYVHQRLVQALQTPMQTILTWSELCKIIGAKSIPLARRLMLLHEDLMIE